MMRNLKTLAVTTMISFPLMSSNHAFSADRKVPLREFENSIKEGPIDDFPESEGPAIPRPNPRLEFLKKANRANLIFAGKVVKIEYSKAKSQTYFNETPLTFVTFEVTKIIKGDKSIKEFTVRSVGGPTGVKGQVVIPSHSNFFRIGATDVVLVSNNTEAMIPILDRIVVLDDTVYSSSGAYLNLSERGELTTSGRNDSEIFTSIQIGDMFFRTESDKDNPIEIEIDTRGVQSNFPVKFPENAQAIRQSLEDFINNLQKSIQPIESPQEEKSADISIDLNL